MTQADSTLVVDSEGAQGRIDPDTRPPEGVFGVMVALADGRRVALPVELLQRRPEGGYRLAQRFAQFDGGTPREGEVVTIPVVEERLAVERRTRERGVRVDKRVLEREAVVDVPLLDEEIQVERVAINRELDAPVGAHYEGETLVVPLLEEVVVTHKRLILREEIRITKRSVRKTEHERVTLRREEAVVRPIEGG